MGRKRKKQKQTARMFFREKDHREIIMDDSYHGAIYLAEQVEPAWRRYKPRLVIGEISSGGLISVDVENNYFSCLTEWRSDNPSDYVRGITSQQPIFRAGYLQAFCSCYDMLPEYRSRLLGAIISKNGYDWKRVDYTDNIHSFNSNVQSYGKDLLFDYIRSNLVCFWKFDYNEGNKYTEGWEHITDLSWQNTNGDYCGVIDTDNYNGCFLYRTVTTIRRVGTTYYYTYNYNIYMFLDLSLPATLCFQKTISDVSQSMQVYTERARDVWWVHKTKDTVFFLQARFKRDLTTNLDQNRLFCYSSSIDNINTSSWIESEIIPWANNNNCQWDYQKYLVLYRNNIVYLYLYCYKVISGNLIRFWRLFTTSDFQQWNEITLPDYLDIPFFNYNNDDYRYGVIIPSPYNKIRIILNTEALNYTLPSGTVLVSYANLADIYGDYIGSGRVNTGYVSRHWNDYFESIDGELTSNISYEDLWLFDLYPNTIIHINNLEFEEDSNNYAYYFPDTPKDTSGNVLYPRFKETIDSSDYIFD